MMIIDKINATLRILCLVVWFTFCVLFSIDTDLFVYPSLSQILLSEICILVLFLCVVVHWIIVKPNFPFGWIQLLVIIWCGYMAVHALFISDAELYRLFYMELTLSLLIIFPYLLRNNLISVKTLENGILLLLVIQITYLILQYAGLLRISDSFFSLTGTNRNPNITAVLIASCIPLLFKRLKTSSYVYGYIALITLSFVYLYLLKCRTAYVGLSIVFVVVLLNTYRVRTFLKRMSYKTKIICGILLVGLLMVSAFCLYGSKQDSSDGRLLVWKLSSRMILERPEGIGIGKYVRDYNIRQSRYFSEEIGTEEERKLAYSVNMAYNDYLEYGVEAGILGVSFLFSFYLVLIYRAYKQHEIFPLAVITAFMTMSFVNFIYTSIQPWLVLLCYASIAIRNDDLKNIRFTKFLLPLKYACALACLLVLYRQINITQAQLELKRNQTALLSGKSVDIDKAKSLAHVISTSEAYWRFMTELYFRKGDYAQAYKCLMNASDYICDASVLIPLYTTCEHMNRASEGLRYLETLRNMIPQNLFSRYLMLKYYHEHSMLEQTIMLAKEITNMQVKIENEQSERIKHYAEYILSNINSTQKP